jgi:hypothetical protein
MVKVDYMNNAHSQIKTIVLGRREYIVKMKLSWNGTSKHLYSTTISIAFAVHNFKLSLKPQILYGWLKSKLV